MKILITGIAGFIGYHLASKLSNERYRIVGIDNLNKYYNVELKEDRLENLGIDTGDIKYGEKYDSRIYGNISFIKLDISDREGIFNLFKEEQFDYVINLAAQAGVRYSLENPYSYIDSNINGFINILEACRTYPVKHLIFASSSSVYGLNSKTPFLETDITDTPASLYAATKKSNELMAHTYAHLFKIPVTGLRFFTVYGPWGRPDMAYFNFTKKILSGEEIGVFNYGEMQRDFTYIDDIVESISKIIEKIPSGNVPMEVYNIGGNSPVQLLDFIHCLENVIGRKAEIKLLPMQQGDVKITYANTEKLEKVISFKPSIGIEQGLTQFYHWYKKYYGDKEQQ